MKFLYASKNVSSLFLIYINVFTFLLRKSFSLIKMKNLKLYFKKSQLINSKTIQNEKSYKLLKNNFNSYLKTSNFSV